VQTAQSNEARMPTSTLLWCWSPCASCEMSHLDVEAPVGLCNTLVCEPNAKSYVEAIDEIDENGLSRTRLPSLRLEAGYEMKELGTKQCHIPPLGKSTCKPNQIPHERERNRRIPLDISCLKTSIRMNKAKCRCNVQCNVRLPCTRHDLAGNMLREIVRELAFVR